MQNEVQSTIKGSFKLIYSIIYFDVIVAVLRWTHDGQEGNSTSLSLSYLENSGSHVILTVERLVDTEITTDIAVTIQGGTRMYSSLFLNI